MSQKMVRLAMLLSTALFMGQPLAAVDQSIKVPAAKFIPNLKQIYKSDGTPQILLILHLPKGPGTTFLELYNLTKRNLATFQFSLHSVGQSGDLSFEDLPAGWSGVKESRMTNIRELAIYQPRAIDDKAVEFFPRLVIHYEIGGLQQKMAPGSKQKISR